MRVRVFLAGTLEYFAVLEYFTETNEMILSDRLEE